MLGGEKSGRLRGKRRKRIGRRRIGGRVGRTWRAGRIE